jgi:hypothetical protein
MKLSDIAWLAGLLEGEGSFSVSVVREGKIQAGKRRLQITLMMTDEDVVRRAAAIMNTKLYGPYGPYKNSVKPCWQIHVGASRAAAWMMTLYSFMGERRRLAIEQGLREWKTFRAASN